MEPYPDIMRRVRLTLGVYLARDGALPRHAAGVDVIGASLSSEGWSPTPTRHERVEDCGESI